MLNINDNESHQEKNIHIIVDEQGFLINPEEWTEAFAENALDLAGKLTSQHLNVIHFVRSKFLHLGALPPVRHVCKSTGMEKSELKLLFGSCLNLWRAAGLPSPDDEIRSHMN